MGRQNVPRAQWLEFGVECPTCGEVVTEADVYTWRPSREEPDLVLLHCPDCGERLEIDHV